MKKLHERQSKTGVDVNFMTVSICLVNIISPQRYGDFHLSCGQVFPQEFGSIAIHNCAWNTDQWQLRRSFWDVATATTTHLSCKGATRASHRTNRRRAYQDRPTDCRAYQDRPTD
ncbi:MAG: hypothetical protein ACYTEX_23270 [Planctomycetota bacterium]